MSNSGQNKTEDYRLGVKQLQLRPGRASSLARDARIADCRGLIELPFS